MAKPKPDSCKSCPGWDWECPTRGFGFIEPQLRGTNGVCLVGEAGGEDESLIGLPFQGKSGAALDKMLIRGGMNRSDFNVANVLSCRPPDNKLAGMWYAEDVTNHCAPHLDGVISATNPRVIVTLGVTAFRRVIPEIANQHGVGLLDSKKHKGARGYVFWSTKYNCWVIPTVHPAFVVRGKTAWTQVIIYDVQRATEIARDGYEYDKVDYLLDPAPYEALKWVAEFEEHLRQTPDTILSCDIETPLKGANEEELDLEDGSDYVVLRCGYSYKDKHGLSIPWDGPYRIIHERLLGANCVHTWWNGSFDIPRVIAQDIQIGGINRDAMDQWHVLNSDLNKSLGFVTPFFRTGQPMWKHLGHDRPAYYNCVDADVAGSNSRGTIALLKKHELWKVYKEFVEELDPVYSAMTKAGMPVDKEIRIASSKKLIERRNEVREKIEALAPIEIKNLSPKAGYIREPANKDGLQEFVFNGIKNNYCGHCGLKSPAKGHFKSKLLKQCSICLKKWIAKHTVQNKKGNPCFGAECITTETNGCSTAQTVERVDGETRWARIEPFVASQKGILRYQLYNKHPYIYVGKGSDKKPTTDEKAIKKLIGKHPTDQFYPLVLDDREYTKVGGTYIGWFNPDKSGGNIEGGFPVGRDGRVHGTFRHSPSTLRSSMVAPNLQNLPRGDDSDVQLWVKQMFIASPGNIFVAADFKGIEAQIVAVHANDREYLRLAKIDIHSYFTSHNLYRQGIIPYEDVPQLKWSDRDLAGHLKIIKKRFNAERNIGKRCIHAGNYRVGPTKLHEEYPKWFPRVKDASAVLHFFYEVFPSINAWHERICLQVDKSTIFRTSFGHVLRFYEVLQWKRAGSGWVWSYGDDAKRLIASGPQSDAALIGKRALKRCFYNYPDTMAKWLRLFVHDDIMVECPINRQDEAASILEFEMNLPTPELPLDPAWKFGNNLCIEVETKRGATWASMV